MFVQNYLRCWNTGTNWNVRSRNVSLTQTGELQWRGFNNNFPFIGRSMDLLPSGIFKIEILVHSIYSDQNPSVLLYF
jgi:hypothetical protein